MVLKKTLLVVIVFFILLAASSLAAVGDDCSVNGDTDCDQTDPDQSRWEVCRNSDNTCQLGLCSDSSSCAAGEGCNPTTQKCEANYCDVNNLNVCKTGWKCDVDNKVCKEGFCKPNDPTYACSPGEGNCNPTTNKCDLTYCYIDPTGNTVDVSCPDGGADNYYGNCNPGDVTKAGDEKCDVTYCDGQNPTCASGFACDTANKKCVQGFCTDDTACDIAKGESCATAGANKNSCVVGFCDEDTDCTGTNEVCDKTTYTCKKAACTDDAQCEEIGKGSCDKASGQCVPTDCSQNANVCSGDELCLSGKCAEAECHANKACANDKVCSSGKCVDKPDTCGNYDKWGKIPEFIKDGKIGFYPIDANNENSCFSRVQTIKKEISTHSAFGGRDCLKFYKGIPIVKFSDTRFDLMGYNKGEHITSKSFKSLPELEKWVDSTDLTVEVEDILYPYQADLNCLPPVVITKATGDFDGDGSVDKTKDLAAVKSAITKDETSRNDFVVFIKSLFQDQDSLAKKLHKYLRQIK